MWFTGITISVIAIDKHIRIANAMAMPRHPMITVMTRWGIEPMYKENAIENQVFFGLHFMLYTSNLLFLAIS